MAWAGNSTFSNNRQRLLPPAKLDVIDLMDGVQDFADTAARVAGLDLVIAVDTAVAATMGKPVWLLSRWRWLLDRADSPWYPSAHRPAGAAKRLAGVVAEVRQESHAPSRDDSAPGGAHAASLQGRLNAIETWDTLTHKASAIPPATSPASHNANTRLRKP